MRLDLDLGRLFEDDKAVSPVIGVILMVAITVILAAVIGTFVLDLGQNVQSNPQAGVAFSETGSGPYDIQISLNSVQRADSMSYSCDSGSTFNSWGSVTVGSTNTCTGVSAGTDVIVRATYNGNTAVIQTTTAG